MNVDLLKTSAAAKHSGQQPQVGCCAVIAPLP
nr:MAG TPA: hypothetical protein [Caudoviricetes sp.]DAM71369.1 MAG TPA: hypothetical protein [Caudoviricetes sp.]